MPILIHLIKFTPPYSSTLFECFKHSLTTKSLNLLKKSNFHKLSYFYGKKKKMISFTMPIFPYLWSFRKPCIPAPLRCEWPAYFKRAATPPIWLDCGDLEKILVESPHLPTHPCYRNLKILLVREVCTSGRRDLREERPAEIWRSTHLQKFDALDCLLLKPALIPLVAICKCGNTNIT
jgi:hypothetical protein